MAGYLGASPVPQSIQKKESFTATASQTTFNTTGYTDGAFINVYLNGVRLINGTDYTATNGSDIVLTSAASASDVLDFETFSEFQLIDQEFGNSVIIENNTSEDSDGGRASKLVYKGKQSGGEQSTLAEIQASHDGTADDEKGDLIFRTNDGSDGASPTERARIDSAGNFMLSKSDVDNATTAGLEIRSTGYTAVARDGADVLSLNRLTSDGSIMNFRKDGTTVGSIGSKSGSLLIGSTDTFLRVNDPSDTIFPSDSGGTERDNAINLGKGSSRFADLYLGGGVYLGGTVAANKLDDYEEGTWTPNFVNGGTIGSVNSATYTKIGRVVKAGFYISGISGIPSNSSLFAVGGLPFTVSGSNSYHAAGGVSYVNGANWASTNAFNTPLSNVSSTYFYFHRRDGNSASVLNSAMTVLNSQEFICTIIYHTDS